MKLRYYVSKHAQSNGDHEVHHEDCAWLPKPENLKPLGEHTHCSTAVHAAKVYYNQVNGCKYCSPSCHTQ
ncbi:MAG: hypothetical protein QM731_02995 [Chitinophagaceae bacterium]